MTRILFTLAMLLLVVPPAFGREMNAGDVTAALSYQPLSPNQFNQAYGVPQIGADGTINLQFVVPQRGTARRTIASKLGDQASLPDFGATCDGVTDDSAAVLAAAASGRRITVPDGLVCNAPSVAQATMAGLFIGGGQVRGSDGNPRGPQFGAVRSPPNPAAWNQAASAEDNCAGGFPCWAKYDYSHQFSAEEFHISGAATLGQPVVSAGQTGVYETMPGANAHSLFIDNASGSNYSHNSNNGRTGGGAWSTLLQTTGGGDFGVFGAHIQCGGLTPPGDGFDPTRSTDPNSDGTSINNYTDWLAVPECGFIGADVAALYAGQYMQLGEFAVNDNNHDVTAIGFVRGYNRVAPTAKINNRWIDELITCNIGITATLPCDAVQVVGGSWAIGHDFIGANIPAPLALSANQKITLNGSAGASLYPEGAPPSKAVLGGDWITDDGTGMVLAQNGGTVLRLSNSGGGTVNSWAMSGNYAGYAPLLQPQGPDANITALIADKGAGGVILQSNGVFALRVTAQGPQTYGKTVASLGPCNGGLEGTRASVTDAVSPTFLGTLTGGGTVHAPAYCNGSAWVAG